MGERRTNWARNLVFQAARLHRPTSVDELQRTVAASSHLRALGTGHSFNPIADCAGDQISVADLPPLFAIDAQRSTVTVSGGVRYGELAQYLHGAGYALRNLGSLPHISVAGACATGTHGSGDGVGNLATAVAAIALVTADGELVTLDRDRPGDEPAFSGAVVGLGSLGVAVGLTLAIEPTYLVSQFVYDDLPTDALDGYFDEIFGAGYSVSLFTDWRGGTFNQVWVKRRVEGQNLTAPEPRWLGARLADGPRHPVPGMSPVHCTEQLGVPGPWHERLPHFRLDFTPSAGRELQSEFMLPRAQAVDAIRAIEAISDVVAPVVQITEVRTIAADELWLSPAYQRDSVGLHFTWIDDLAALTPVLTQVEERLAPFGPRPHWGKLFSANPAGRYQRMHDFSELRRGYDPAGKFGNDFLDTFLTPPRQRSPLR
jgi:alditol oxidase